MKLCCSLGVCQQGSPIAIVEAGLAFEAIHVDLGTKRARPAGMSPIAPLTFPFDCVPTWYGTRCAAGLG